MSKQAQSRNSHWGIFAAALILMFVVVAVAALAGFAAAYEQRFPPRARIGGVSVSGLDYLGALKLIRQRSERLLTDGLRVKNETQTVAIEPAVSSPDELYYELFSIDPEATVRRAYAAYHPAGLFRRLARQLGGLISGAAAPVVYAFDAPAFRKTLEQNFSADERRATNARIRAIAKPLSVAVEPAAAGFRYDYDAVVRAARQQVAALNGAILSVQSVREEPAISAAEVQDQLETVKQAIGRAPFTLVAQEKTFPVTAEAIARSITLVRGQQRVALGLDAEVLGPILDEVAKAVEVPVQEARFALADGRVTEFAQSRTGIELDRQATADLLASRLTSGDVSVAIAVSEVQPNFTTASINDLGITELVAEGRTSFAGSPPNRRFNIGVGVSKLNGLLIKPGEEFSLIKALGPIDGKNGFKQELVIKGNRTIPEFGGGLCQIGTTFFRLVLNAGLPVLERQNHSYRVRYYEPPVGMDATIYEPKPDFRFQNDYAAALLLQTRVEGDEVVFQFYGKKDARVAKSTEPRIFNIRAPPAKKTIETTDLKPGEVNCIEKPHPGSDAEFTYTVAYPDGQTKEQVFKSHYRPWGEVCLVGVKKAKAKPAAD